MIAEPVPAVRRARILIVDDAPDNRELLQVILAWEGFETETAGSGEEALTRIAEAPPDLVLLDLVLPGLGGCEVAAEMKRNALTKSIPILIMSGMTDSVTRRRALSAGAEQLIDKPIDRAALCGTMRAILGLAARPES